MAVDGKRQKAPCGHDGETIVGQFVLCLRKCDKRSCTQCGGTAFSPFMLPGYPDGSVSCDKCGRVRWSHDGK